MVGEKGRLRADRPKSKEFGGRRSRKGGEKPFRFSPTRNIVSIIASQRRSAIMFSPKAPQCQFGPGSDRMPSVRARKPTGSVFMVKRTREPYPHLQRTSEAQGPTAPARHRSHQPLPTGGRYTRASGRRPSGRGAKSTISSWRGLRWPSGSGTGGRVRRLVLSEVSTGLVLLRFRLYIRGDAL